jgi:hypothetical protein
MNVEQGDDGPATAGPEFLTRTKVAAVTVRDIAISVQDSRGCWPADTPFRFTWKSRDTQ